jgi:hypothetical protein
MKTIAGRVLETTKQYPFSIGGFLFTLVPWALVYFVLIRINLQPAPKGIPDHRGEGLIFWVILALLIAAIFTAITVLNLILQKDKPFYVKLTAVTILLNIFLYGIGLIS